MTNTKEKSEIVPAIIQTNDIDRLIYTIRGRQVMLDHDLAALYGYEVRALNQQVKRNIGRFPADFMFQLTKEELGIVKSQIVTSSVPNFYSGQEGGRRKPPYPNIQGLFAKLNGLRKKMFGAAGTDEGFRVFF